MRKLAAGAGMAVTLLFTLSADPPPKSKVHGFSLTGTIVGVDDAGKTFTVKGSTGRQISLAWTAATTVTGGSLKPGEKVTLRYLDKDRKHIATSIHVGPVAVVTPRLAATAPALTATPH